MNVGGCVARAWRLRCNFSIPSPRTIFSAWQSRRRRPLEDEMVVQLESEAAAYLDLLKATLIPVL
jgi:hypothetical protein